LQVTAWISIVAFRLEVRLRWLPPLSFCTNFLELNLRTYVRYQGEAGIYFLSIHAGRRTAVALASLLTPLPYVYAPLSYCQAGERWKLVCRLAGAPAGPPLLEGEFSPTAVSTSPLCDSVDAWLLERYRAFVPSRRRRLRRMAAQHQPWSIQRVAAHIQANNLGAPWGLDLRRQPDKVHFAARMPALLWPFETVHDGLA